MVFSKWWTYVRQVVRYETDSIGVYELGDVRTNTLFLGSGPLRESLIGHLDRHEFPLSALYRVEILGDEATSRARERQLLYEHGKRYGVLPLYNRAKSPTGNH